MMADHVVGVEKPENRTREELEIAMDINLDLTRGVEGRGSSKSRQKSPGRVQGWRQLK